MRSLIGICALVAFSGGCVQGPSAGQGAAFGLVSQAPYEPAGSQTLVVHSGIVGRNFVVVVTPPPSEVYNMKVDWKPEQKLPAIYALDGGYGVAGPLAQMMAGQGVMAPAYVVSISYPKGDGDYRNTDFLHRKAMETTGNIGGGGQAYADFLTKELKPFLEVRFAMDPKKAILFGHSFGGLFALNVLATQPDAFDRYVIASPSTLRDADLMRDLPKTAQAARGKRVYVAVGGNELVQMKAGAEKTASVLKAAGLTVESHVFIGENHISYFPQLVPAAFAWILPPEKSGPATAVTQAQLDRLTGTYAFEDGRVATFISRDGKLIARISNLPGEAVLEAETPVRFVIPQYGVTMSFEDAADAPATAVTVRINGADSRAVRQLP